MMGGYLISPRLINQSFFKKCVDIVSIMSRMTIPSDIKEGR
jgi:hypothetical protein